MYKGFISSSILSRLWHGTYYFYRRTRRPQYAASQEAWFSTFSIVPGGKQFCRRKFPAGVHPAAFFRHGVKAPSPQRIAPDEPGDRQQQTLDTAMYFNGLQSVVAARRAEPAVPAQCRADEPLIEADGRAERAAAAVAEVFESAHWAGFCFRAGGTVAGGGASGRFALSGRPACANSFATTLLSCQLFRCGVMPRATKMRS